MVEFILDQICYFFFFKFGSFKFLVDSGWEYQLLRFSNCAFGLDQAHVNYDQTQNFNSQLNLLLSFAWLTGGRKSYKTRVTWTSDKMLSMFSSAGTLSRYLHEKP